MIIKTLTVLRRPDSNRPIVMQWPCALAGVLALAYLLSACAAKMSLQEAQQVAVTMSHTDYSPPPRSIDDITAVFDQIPDDPEKIQQLMHKASAEPPAGTPPDQEGNFMVCFTSEPLNTRRAKQGGEF